MQDTTEVYVLYIAHTDDAVLVADYASEEIWVPRSQIREEPKIDWASYSAEDLIQIQIADWFIEKENIETM